MRPKFSAFVRIRPGGVSDGLVHTDDDDPAYVELLTMAGAPLDVEIEPVNATLPTEYVERLERLTDDD